MTKHTKKLSQGESIRLIFLGLVGLVVIITMLLQGTDVTLFNPKGLIAGEQSRLIIFVVALLMEIAVPSLIIFYFVAWKYRENNEKSQYEPNAHYGKFFIFSLWAIPSIFMLTIASVMWPATHKLEPQKAIASSAKPLTIQVVAQRWKWLFIYPEQNIATVNFVQVPIDVPVQFELTADEAPMSSFWIPHFGGQLYAMTGHVNRLNLMADTSGDYSGRSAEINGAGFAGMKFTARASTKADFELWVQSTKQSADILDSMTYKKLLTPSEYNSASYYSDVQSDLFNNILVKYMGSHGGHMGHE